MPISALDHRIRSGCFTGTLISILCKKAMSFCRVHAYRGMKVGRRTLMASLATIALALLLLCGDVESNPGPGQGHDQKDPKGNPNAAKGQVRQTRLSTSATNHPACPEPTLSDLMGKLTNMEYVVNEKLDGVRADVNLKLDNIKEDINMIRHQVGGLQRDMDSLNEHVGSLQKENESLKRSNEELLERLARVERKADDLEGRSRRNNLLFYGLDREENETDISCEERLRELLTDQLELAEDIEFDRVHRVGPKQNAPIIARCTHYKHKVKILRARQKLKGTRIFINEDFSERVRGVRKALRKCMGDLNKSGKKVNLVYDHLFVDGRKYVLDADGESLVAEGQ